MNANEYEMSEKQELKDRIDARRKRLEARLTELKADARGDASEARDRIQSRLDELRETYGERADEITESMAAKLNDWLARSDD